MKQIFIIINILLFCFCFSFAVTNQHLLLEISSENLPEGGIKVLFILEDFADANLFYYRGDKPRVVCDFIDVGVKPGLQKEIRVNTDYIQNVRIGEHKSPSQKVRVVLDLVPDHDYNISKLPSHANIFSVIIKTSTKTVVPDDDIRITQEKNPESEPKPEPVSESKAEKVINNQLSTINKSDLTDDSKADIDSSHMEYIPFKWPLRRTYGKIKMVAHMEIDTNGFACVKGYLINSSNNFYYSVLLDFDIYDIQDDLVGCQTGMFYNLKPGARRIFIEHIDIKTATRFRIGDTIFW